MLTLITGRAGTGKTIVANALKSLNKLDVVYDDVGYNISRDEGPSLIEKINKSLKSKKNVGVVVHNEEYVLDELDLKDETIRIINVSIGYVQNTKLSRHSLTDSQEGNQE